LPYAVAPECCNLHILFQTTLALTQRRR